MRILIAVILLVLFFWLQYRLWIGSGSLGQKAELEREIDQQQRVNLELKTRNDQVVDEIEALSTGTEGLEEVARSRLGMIGDDEIFYMIPERETAEKNTTFDSGSKPDDQTVFE